MKAHLEAVTGGNKAFDEMDLQALMVESLTENREVMGFMLRTSARMAQGLEMAPPKPIWTPQSSAE